MRKDQKWGGLVTRASPYLLPRGASQEQVNVHCRIPGVLQSRLGMLPLSAGQAVPAARDVFSLHGPQGSVTLCLKPSGELEALGALGAFLAPNSNVYEPPLATAEGQTATNYLWQYQTDFGTTANLVTVFYGGSAGQQSWQYQVTPSRCTAMSLVSASAGRANITVVRGVSGRELCQYGDD
jgi:hypothetical protein